MALSDACFDFVTAARTEMSDAGRKRIALELADAITHYSASPLDYGDELETLAIACGSFISGRSSANDDPWARLLFLADAIREGLDMPPPEPGPERP